VADPDGVCLDPDPVKRQDPVIKAPGSATLQESRRSLGVKMIMVKLVQVFRIGQEHLTLKCFTTRLERPHHRVDSGRGEGW
jgi:hypothetical protein